MRRGIRGGTVTLKGLTYSDGKGGRYYYYRHRGKKTPLGKGPIDSPDFLRKYAEAVNASPKSEPRAKAGSLASTCAAFRASTTFSGYSASYKGIMHRHMADMCSSPERKDAPISGIRAKHIRADLSQMDPHPARHRLKVWRQVCTFALDSGWTEVNAAAEVSAPKAPKTEGHAPWSPTDIAEFRKRWPIGTVQRLCFEVIYWTGARTIDAVTLSASHVDRDGVLTFRQAKTGSPAHVPWSCALPTWAASMSDDQDVLHQCLRKSTFTFLESVGGRARSVKGLSNLISKAARDTEIHGKTAHGLRKSRLTAIAQAGGSVHTIMSWGGHVTLSEAQHYITSLNRKTAIMGTEQVQNSANPPAQRANTLGK